MMALQRQAVKMNPPNVSLIIPAYNVETYISECLESVVNQTLENIEIIIVDDGSTDNTLQVSEKYQSIDSRIKIIKQANSGTSCARNIGVKQSTGEYVLFIDSDDWIANNTCEILYKKAKKHNLDVLVYEYYLAIGDRRIKRNSYLHENIITGKIFLTESLNYNSFCLSACNKFITRDLAIKIPFRENHVHEDIEFSYLIMLDAKRVAMCNEYLYYYRRFRTGSNTSELKMKNIFDLFKIYNFIETSICKSSFSDVLKSNGYNIAKFEKLNMESVYKLIDKSNKNDGTKQIIHFLKSNNEFRRLGWFYVLNGKSIKHKLSFTLFWLQPKIFMSLGKLSYPVLRLLKLAV
ncbi:glycosyl transferase [Desulfocapsa sulfexigens DSM 10523]|uniref:Glycosyl transferase n=1 Tax=Desulfocapsa sulfexigens (strain DSM 10523 / SB164P1) TaxID=1167006 RepID=M1PAW8_DESSD|nr:glycosyltransferase family 2 protein [Desulfocapsa sulfexigens]AGF78797.1 glycosyl transferase [Desulfocapsa sulfexigens DSM 10523]